MALLAVDVIVERFLSSLYLIERPNPAFSPGSPRQRDARSKVRASRLW
jgi:hypothetical protein